jgi:hypothetical protein
LKSYLFNSDDYNLIRYLKSETPQKIWWTPIQYIFEYERFYIELRIHCCEDKPISINNYSYIMTIKLKKIFGKYSNFGGSIILTENRRISNIYIVRTIIYFHDYSNRKYTEHRNHPYFGHFQINPKEKLDTEIENPYLVDIGLLINMDSDFIEAYSKDNDDDFFRYDENYLLRNFDITEQPKEYEYIKFE